MGNPFWCYEEILKETIRLGTDELSVEKNEEKLKDKSIEELETIVKNGLSCNYPLKCFYAGFAVSEFMSKNKDYGDILNACCSSISMVYDLLNIKEEDDEDEE